MRARAEGRQPDLGMDRRWAVGLVLVGAAATLTLIPGLGWAVRLWPLALVWIGVQLLRGKPVLPGFLNPSPTAAEAAAPRGSLPSPGIPFPPLPPQPQPQPQPDKHTRGAHGGGRRAACPERQRRKEMTMGSRQRLDRRCADPRRHGLPAEHPRPGGHRRHAPLLALILIAIGLRLVIRDRRRGSPPPADAPPPPPAT